eukprot:jgi/Psemu1/30527/gm1.30527_g
MFSWKFSFSDRVTLRKSASFEASIRHPRPTSGRPTSQPGPTLQWLPRAAPPAQVTPNIASCDIPVLYGQDEGGHPLLRRAVGQRHGRERDRRAPEKGAGVGPPGGEHGERDALMQYHDHALTSAIGGEQDVFVVELEIHERPVAGESERVPPQTFELSSFGVVQVSPRYIFKVGEAFEGGSYAVRLQALDPCGHQAADFNAHGRQQVRDRPRSVIGRKRLPLPKLNKVFCLDAREFDQGETDGRPDEYLVRVSEDIVAERGDPGRPCFTHGRGVGRSCVLGECQGCGEGGIQQIVLPQKAQFADLLRKIAAIGRGGQVLEVFDVDPAFKQGAPRNAA